MGLFDSKFLNSVPASPFFSNTEILLTRNRVNWSLGNSFRRVLSGGVNYFKFQNTQDRRQIYLVIENSSLTEAATVYFPVGYWENGSAIAEIDANSRLLLRIVSQNGNFYYQAIDDMNLFTPPAPNSDLQFLNVVNTNINGIEPLVAIDNLDSNALFVANGREQVSLLPVVQFNGLTFEKSSSGLLDPLVTKFLSDDRIEGIVIDEANEVAYVCGFFDSRFNQSSLVGGTQYSLVEVDLTNGSFALIVGGLTSITNANLAKEGDIVVMIGGGVNTYGINVATASIEWTKTCTAYTRRVPIQKYSGAMYFDQEGTFDSVGPGGVRNFIAKIDPLTGNPDATFINNQGTGANSGLIQGIVVNANGVFVVGAGMTTFNAVACKLLIKLTLLGARDLSIASNTGLDTTSPGTHIRIAQGPAGTLLIGYSSTSALQGTYSNAGVNNSGTNFRMIYKVNESNGFANAFTVGVSGFAGGSGEIITPYYDGTDIFANCSNGLVSIGLKYISKINYTTGVIDTNYNAGIRNSAVSGGLGVGYLVPYTDLIILVKQFGFVSNANEISGGSFYNSSAENVLARIDYSDYSIDDTLVQAGVSNSVAVIKLGEGVHADKLFVGYTGTANQPFFRVFDKLTLNEITGYPTFPGTNLTTPRSVRSIDQVGDYVYLGGMFDNVDDGSVKNIAGMVKVNLVTKLIDTSFNGLPVQQRASLSVGMAEVWMTRQYENRIMALLRLENSGNQNSPTAATVISINKLTGEVHGNVGPKTSNFTLQHGFALGRKGLATLSPLGPNARGIVFDLENFLPQNPSAVVNGSPSPRCSVAFIDKLNQFSGISYEGTFQAATIDAETAVLSTQTIPPVTSVGNLNPCGGVVPRVNANNTFVSIFSNGINSQLFNNKRRWGYAQFNQNISDFSESVNVPVAPTTLSIAETSVTMKIKRKSYNALTLTSDQSNIGFVTDSTLPEGVMVNVNTGALMGTPSVAEISSSPVIIKAKNPAGQVSAPSITLNVVDRAPWRNIALGNGASVAVLDSQLEVNDQIFVGGDFTHAGLVYNGLARIAVSGGLNKTALAKCHDFNGLVKRILVDGNNAFVFGDFTKYGEFDYPYFVKINLTTGEADHTFMSALGSSFGGFSSVNNRVVYGQILGNALYIAGCFTTFNGDAVGNVINLNKNTGERDVAFTAGVAAGGEILDLAFDAIEGRLWAVGTFTSFASNSNAARLAVLSALTGALVPSYFSVSAFNDSARNIKAKDGFIYITGDFTTYRGVGEIGLVKLNSSTGNAVAGFSKYTVASPESIAISDTTLAVIDNAGTYDGSATNGFFVVDLSTGNRVVSAALTFDASARSVSTVGADIYAIGGDFTEYSPGQPSRKLVTYNATTFAVVNAYSGNRFSQQKAILDVAVYSGEYLIANSDAWDLDACDNLAKFTYSESNGLELNASFPQANDRVRKIFKDPASDSIFIGGDFTTVGVTARNRIAKLALSTGAHDANFNPGTGFDNSVYDITAINLQFFAGNLLMQLIVGGAFANYNGVATAGLADLNSYSGARFGGASSITGIVTKLKRNYNEPFYTVLGPTAINGTPVTGGFNIFVMNAVGSPPTAFYPGLTAAAIDFDIDICNNTIILQSDSTLRRYDAGTSKTLRNSKTFVFTGTNPKINSQGQFSTLIGSLGDTFTYDATPIPGTAVPLADKDLAYSAGFNFEVDEATSANGTVKFAEPHLDTIMVGAESSVPLQVPFINSMYGHIVRLTKRGNNTPYND